MLLELSHRILPSTHILRIGRRGGVGEPEREKEVERVGKGKEIDNFLIWWLCFWKIRKWESRSRRNYFNEKDVTWKYPRDAGNGRDIESSSASGLVHFEYKFCFFNKWLLKFYLSLSLILFLSFHLSFFLYFSLWHFFFSWLLKWKTLFGKFNFKFHLKSEDFGSKKFI